VIEHLPRPDPPTPGPVRDWVWAALMRARQVAYPLPPHGHHPNFTGAGEAATRLLEHLFESNALRPGDTVLSYPDYVLKPLRKGLLEAGVSVVVPAKHGPHYQLLESGEVPPGGASSIAGAERHGQHLETFSPAHTLRFAFVACVAVSGRGEVLSKGYGFRLPEEARGLPAATLAHPLQVFESLEGDAPKVVLYATPQEVKNLSARAEGGS